MPPQRCDPGSLQPSWPTSYNHHFSRPLCPLQPVRPLSTSSGIDSTRQGLPPRNSSHASIVTPNTGANPFFISFFRLLYPKGVGEQSRPYGHHICFPFRNDLFGKLRIRQFSHGDNRNLDDFLSRGRHISHET